MEDDVPRAKKSKLLPHEHLFLKRLPSSLYYEKSYMHRDTISHVVSTPDGYIISASIDGYIKFWRRVTIEVGVPTPAQNVAGIIEFLKTFRAHTGPITDMVVTRKGHLLATVSVDQTLKTFDIQSLELLTMKKLDFAPEVTCWIEGESSSEQQLKLIVADKEKATLSLVTPFDGDEIAPLTWITPAVIKKVAYSKKRNVLIAITGEGEVLLIDFAKLEKDTPLEHCLLTHQFDDLFKEKISPLSLAISPDEDSFAVLGSDRFIRLLKFSTGKLYKKYDESLSHYQKQQKNDTADEDEESAGVADQKDLLQLQREEELMTTPYNSLNNFCYDESGNFLLLASPIGIKILNLVTNKVSRIVGKTDASDLRFINIALFQGTSRVLGLPLEMAASDNPALTAGSNTVSVILAATALRRNRFYLFTNTGEFNKEGRDVMNERLDHAETIKAINSSKSPPKAAILRTSVGDIHITLFPDKAPLAVENFVGHARSGYYDNVLFHRVIRGFMVQTGDPLGDGTGGVSIWGKEFKDEFHPDLRHDQPFTVSMANAGRNTNGSQFFITVTKCPWLDDKHTIFGRVFKGQEVVSKIEATETDKLDKPKRDVKILQIDIVK